MELTFLGTASGRPTPTRGVSCIIFRNDGVHWMLDCGEGSQVQLMRSAIRPGRISKIFITHLHGDHIFGLPGLLCTISQNLSAETKAVVQLYGPTGLRRFLRVSLELSRSQLGFDYVVHELMPSQSQYPDAWEEWAVEHEADENLHPNEQAGLTISSDASGVWHVCEDGRMLVTAGSLQHRIPCFGYVIEEKPAPGKLDVAKLKEKGVTPGPLYSKVKAGETIMSPSGEKIHPNEVVGAPRPGRKVAILGDTNNSDGMRVMCEGADALVHESTLCDQMKEQAIEKGHSTSGMAGAFAKSVGAKLLVLTHFSPRYRPLSSEPKEGEESVGQLLEEAKVAFDLGSVIAAEDLYTLAVPPRKT